MLTEIITVSFFYLYLIFDLHYFYILFLGVLINKYKHAFFYEYIQ